MHAGRLFQYRGNIPLRTRRRAMASSSCLSLLAWTLISEMTRLWSKKVESPFTLYSKAWKETSRCKKTYCPIKVITLLSVLEAANLLFLVFGAGFETSVKFLGN